MLTTANYQREEGVLRSGEVIEPEYSDALLKDPKTKIYYHAVPGAITHLPDGAEIRFRGGMFASNNPEINAYLDRLVDKGGTMIFSSKVGQARIEAEADKVAEEASKPAGDAAKDLDLSQVQKLPT